MVSSHGSHIQAVNKFLSPIADRRNGLLTVDAVQYTEDALRNYQHTHGNVSQDEDEWAEALGENASLGDLLRLFVGLRDNQSQANVVGIWTGNRPRAGWNWIISRAAQIDPPERSGGVGESQHEPKHRRKQKSEQGLYKVPPQ